MKKIKKASKFAFSIFIWGAALGLAVFFIPKIGLAPEQKQLVMQSDAKPKNNTAEFSEMSQDTNLELDLSAKNYLVAEINSGQIKTLAQKNVSESVPIASLTKLMTGYLFLSRNYDNTYHQVEPDYLVNARPTLNLQPGEKVLAKDLYYSMMIGSANDAALNLGRWIELQSGSKISDLMNQSAKTLNLSETHYNNPIGFDSDQNYSSALDTAALIASMLKFENFSKIGNAKNYSFTSPQGSVHTINATNKLVGQSADWLAVKTGFTDEAQGAMVMIKKLSANNFALTIVMRSQNRERDTIKLQQYYDERYGTKLNDALIGNGR